MSVRRVLTAGLLLVAIALFTPAAGADEGIPPEKQGWWTTTGSPAPGLTPVGGASAGAPDVKPGQLYVSGSANQVVAAAAVRYLLPVGVSADTLSLTTAPGTVTVPGTTVRACPLTDDRDFTAAEGGAMNDAPTWDCSRAMPGEVDPSGVAYRFAVAGLVDHDILAIAIVPGGSADRVVLAGPDPTALTVRRTAPSPRVLSPSPSAGGVVRPPGVTNSAVVLPPRAPVAPTRGNAVPTGSTAPTAAPSGATRNATAVLTGHGNTPPAATLGAAAVIVFAIVVWWRGRQTVERLAPASAP